MLTSKESVIYSHCCPWHQEHRRYPELQQDHGYQGNQENQQYQQHPVGERGREGCQSYSCADNKKNKSDLWVEYLQELP